jgi:hypothetical protein
MGAAMTQNRKEKKEARELQRRTGWAYQRCLNMLRTKTPEQIEDAVAGRMKQLAEGVKEAGEC